MRSLFDFSRVLDWVTKMYGYISLLDVILALLGLFVFSCAVEKFMSKGRRPMVWPVFGILPSVPSKPEKIYDWSTQALIGSGGTFPYRGMWFGGAYGIVTCNSVNIEYMLKTRFHNFPKGQYYRDRFRDLLGGGIFNVDEVPWREQRRLATSEMHSARFVDHSYRTMQELVHQKLLKLLEKLAGTGDQIDFQDLLLRFTFDNICTAAFGVDPGCLALELPDVPFATAFEMATELTLFRFLLPPFVWKPMRYFGLGYEGRLKKALKVVHEFAHKTVQDRRAERTKLGSLRHRSDLLSRLMERPDNFSDRFLMDFCVSFILAGRDTSSVALVWFFWLVYEHPDVESRILHELQEILSLRGTANKEKSSSEEVVFTTQELNKMVYLQAALSESLRLYPAVPMEIKEVLEDDVLPDGAVVKKGARVLYCIFSMARMENLWGKDCLEFKPERWMRDGEFVGESPFKYAVFNAGPRLCIGKKFAYMQMKMVAASVLLRYSIRVAKGSCAIPKMTTTLYMKYGLPVTVQPRSNL
ncbi:hypothetical protein CRG98_002600 [Punica granatum]|uniref:Cytochrome P450 86B1-like n=1 Tax=Punica granatum TaxID=22663 RepID=A0A2I0L8S8_PUNGR|nr:hypothetical protein CRG98_002600 [Punica granatum]